MKSSFIANAVVITVLLLVSPGLRADEGTGSLDKAHHLLQAAAGEPGEPPSSDEQKKDLDGAMKEFKDLPKVYHGKLARAKQSLQAVIDEQSSADPSKVRSDILEVDDMVRTLMQ